ncbi:2-hydroxy-3-oxopropionate reductase [Alcanivorax sp. N3-2A]|nr:2-hydroxy-3-oxopropionate reductase [Alcanivorax sp. N3-2A]|tara:strand:- start:19956 stop:20849 length:894 start_codon:yes stop_codon:yes gene_type:complete
MHIAFIGLGIMGSRMALNLVRGGHSVTVWNRSPQPMEALREAGADASSGPAEAVKDATVVFSMLSAPPVLEQVALGEHGFLPAMRTGALWVECSTVDPAFAERENEAARARGVRFIDAPVAGSKPNAEQGTLTFLAGAAPADLQEVMPLLQIMGSKVVHVGAVGRGAGFKMLVNGMLAQSMLMFSETLLVGEKMGLDRDFLLDTLPALPVAAPFLGAKAELIRQGEFEARFPLELMHKDLRLLTQTAHQYEQPLPLATLTETIYGEARAALGRQDFAAIYPFLREKSGGQGSQSDDD